jgi:Secretion system C-terminal sorting domain
MKRVLLVLALLSMGFYGFSQDDIPKVYDFTGYAGAGLTPSPAADQLDSDSWSVIGLSDGDSGFGETNTTGDFARGNTTGGVGTGGLYSLNNGAFWFQPTSNDLTPGDLILKICNNSGSTLVDIDVDYDINYLNDQNRANSFNFSWAKTSNQTYTTVGALDFTTPQASDNNGVQTEAKNTTITANLNDGDCLLLKWSSNDVSGSGSRDEIGVDNIDVKESNIPTPVTLTSFTAKPMDAKTVALNWSTASEENNDYFSIEYSADGLDFIELEKMAGAGTSTATQNYHFMHKEAVEGSNYYRLRQVDFDGTFSFSEIEVVVLEDRSDIRVQPTLAQQSIEVSINEKLINNGNIKVVNWIGQVVKNETFSAKSDKMTLNISDLKSGHYIVMIKTASGFKSSRFVKF